MVNYNGNQKAVVRVNPLVPLEALTPVICDKCEFDPAHALLLKDGISRHELPLDKSLSELGIKELYVHDRSLGKPQLLDFVFFGVVWKCGSGMIPLKHWILKK